MSQRATIATKRRCTVCHKTHPETVRRCPCGNQHFDNVYVTETVPERPKTNTGETENANAK